MRRQLHFALLFALAGLASGQSTPAPSPPRLAFTNVTVIDTTGGRPGQRATVVITRDRISEVGEPDKVSILAEREKGKIGDLVLLEADPLETIANTQKIAGMVVAGKYFGRPALDEMLHKVEEAVKPK